jgi:hypothetical protein
MLRHDDVVSLYESYTNGGISRRAFMARATALGIAGVGAAVLAPLAVRPASAAALAQASLAQLSAAKTLPLDVAEWSYMWVNVKRADTARGSFIGGQQMYVEYMVPARVRKPFPIVLVHGGGGQGLDWMGTPDGRPIGPATEGRRSIRISTAPYPSVREPWKVCRASSSFPSAARKIRTRIAGITHSGPAPGCRDRPRWRSSLHRRAAVTW